jgi:hypothetical protein
MEKLNKSLSFFKKSMGGIFMVVTGIFAMYYFICRTVEAMKHQLDLDYSFFVKNQFHPTKAIMNRTCYLTT